MRGNNNITWRVFKNCLLAAAIIKLVEFLHISYTFTHTFTQWLSNAQMVDVLVRVLTGARQQL